MNWLEEHQTDTDLDEPLRLPKQVLSRHTTLVHMLIDTPPAAHSNTPCNHHASHLQYRHIPTYGSYQPLDILPR